VSNVTRNPIEPGTETGQIAVWDHDRKKWEPGSPDPVLGTGDPTERFRWQVGDVHATWDQGDWINIRDCGDADGSGTWTAAIAEAMNRSDTYKVPVFIPPGTYITDTINYRMQSVIGVDADQSKLQSLPGKDLFHVDPTLTQFYRSTGEFARLTIIVDDTVDASASFPDRGGVGNAGYACDYRDKNTPAPPSAINWQHHHLFFRSLSNTIGGQNASAGIYTQNNHFTQNFMSNLSFSYLKYGWRDHYPVVNFTPYVTSFSRDHPQVHFLHFLRNGYQWTTYGWGVGEVSNVMFHGGPSIVDLDSDWNYMHVAAVEMVGNSSQLNWLQSTRSYKNEYTAFTWSTNVGVQAVFNEDESIFRGNINVPSTAQPWLRVNGNYNEFYLTSIDPGQTNYGMDFVDDRGRANSFVGGRTPSITTWHRKQAMTPDGNRLAHRRDSLSGLLGVVDPMFLSSDDLLISGRDMKQTAAQGTGWDIIYDTTVDFRAHFRRLGTAITFDNNHLNGVSGFTVGQFLAPGKYRIYLKQKADVAGNVTWTFQAPSGTTKGNAVTAMTTAWSVVSLDVDLTGVAAGTTLRLTSSVLAGATAIDIAWILFRPYAADWLVTGAIEGLKDKGGQVFNVRAYGAKGDGATDDSAAFQAAINAAIAVQGGTVFIPPANQSQWYSLATTITIQPASGAQAWFSLEASTAPATASIRWAGGSNSQVFRVIGWKYGRCKGVGVYIPTQDNVVIFDILQQAGKASCGVLEWDQCCHNLGTGRSNTGWRWGAALASGEASFHAFRNCIVTNGGSDNTRGHRGWANYDGNHLASQWDNCGSSYMTYQYDAIMESDRINAAIDNAVTTLPLYAVTGFPPSGRVKIDTEEVDYTGISGTSLTGCTRGVNSTTPASHVLNSIVSSGVQNPLTNAYAYGATGGAGHTFNGCGGSYNLRDFRTGRGVVRINGGRWEGVNRFIETNNGGTGAVDLSVEGAVIAVSTGLPADGIIIALAQPGSYAFESCQFYAADFTAAFLTAGVWDQGGGPAGAGKVKLANCQIRGASGDTFWTLTPATWIIDTSGSYRANSAGQFAQWLDGANAPALRTVSGNQTLNARDQTVLVDSASAVATMTLPTAVNNKWQITVKRLSASNNVTLDGNASETIDGAATKVLGSQYAYATLASDGANVYIVAQAGTIT